MQNWKLTPDIAPVNDDSLSSAIVPDRMSTFNHPKLKFNFTVQFFFRQNAPREQGSDDVADMSLAAKQATRPNPSVILQDANFYNFRTKIRTRVDYGTCTVTLYDDATNDAHNIFKSYLNAISPISNDAVGGAVDNLDTLGQSTASSTGPLTANRHGVIRKIRVTHHYRSGPSSKERKIHYDYLNPKVVNFVLDELDMSQSDVNTITMTFSYDSVVMIQE